MSPERSSPNRRTTQIRVPNRRGRTSSGIVRNSGEPRPILGETTERIPLSLATGGSSIGSSISSGLGYDGPGPNRCLGVLAVSPCLAEPISQSQSDRRTNREIKRRTDAVGVLLNVDSILRLVGTLPRQQYRQWQNEKNYLDPGAIRQIVAGA